MSIQHHAITVKPFWLVHKQLMGLALIEPAVRMVLSVCAVDVLLAMLDLL